VLNKKGDTRGLGGVPTSSLLSSYTWHMEKYVWYFMVNLMHIEYIHTRKVINSEEGIFTFVVVNVINVMIFD
jgi:hypothetical protein